MEFYIRIPLPKAPFTFSHTEQTILLGSCFAENIGKMLEENKFKTDLNPFVRNGSQEMIFSGTKGFTIASAITAVFPHLRKRNA